MKTLAGDVLERNKLKVGGGVCVRHYPDLNPVTGIPSSSASTSDDVGVGEVCNSMSSTSISSSTSDPRLGAHVDANFVTLLWSTTTGLQVPREGVVDKCDLQR